MACTVESGRKHSEQNIHVPLKIEKRKRATNRETKQMWGWWKIGRFGYTAGDNNNYSVVSSNDCALPFV